MNNLMDIPIAQWPLMNRVQLAIIVFAIAIFFFSMFMILHDIRKEQKRKARIRSLRPRLHVVPKEK